METTQFTAPDIECEGCANAIRKTLGGIDGVSLVEVAVSTKTITVAHEPRVSRDSLSAALNRAGFPAN